MKWLSWFLQNKAALNENQDDPKLRPLFLPIPPEEVMRFIIDQISDQPRWRLVNADFSNQTIHLVRVTRVWRFKDDVLIRVKSTENGNGSLILATSESRVGKGDLGQNARNLRALRTILSEKRLMLNDFAGS